MLNARTVPADNCLNNNDSARTISYIFVFTILFCSLIIQLWINQRTSWGRITWQYVFVFTISLCRKVPITFFNLTWPKISYKRFICRASLKCVGSSPCCYLIKEDCMMLRTIKDEWTSQGQRINHSLQHRHHGWHGSKDPGWKRIQVQNSECCCTGRIGRNIRSVWKVIGKTFCIRPEAGDYHSCLIFIGPNFIQAATPRLIFWTVAPASWN